jgi:hypothetical protein
MSRTVKVTLLFLHCHTRLDTEYIVVVTTAKRAPRHVLQSHGRELVRLDGIAMPRSALMLDVYEV